MGWLILDISLGIIWRRVSWIRQPYHSWQSSTQHLKTLESTSALLQIRLEKMRQLYSCLYKVSCNYLILVMHNTLRTGDADLRFYITTVQDGWHKSASLTRACFPCTIHLIMQYIEPVSEWSCWRMFIETWPHSELTFRHRASSI